MHNHGNNNSNSGHNSKMMWFMMLGCMLPVLFVSFVGGNSGGTPIWLPILVIGAMLALHWYGMRGHSSHKHMGNVATSNQPTVAAAINQDDVGVQPPPANPSAVKEGNKHDCC